MGEQASLDSFKEKAQSEKNSSDDSRSPLSFNQFIPIPEELNITRRHFALDESKLSEEQLKEKRELEALYAANKKKYGFETWYEWCIHNWDTKWDACDVYIEEDVPGKLWYRYDTAWGPAMTIVHKMSELYPDLTFVLEYDESGMDFAGAVKFINGEYVRSIETVSPSNLQYDEDYEPIEGPNPALEAVENELQSIWED